MAASQAMPMDYDNSKPPFYSEAERMFDTRRIGPPTAVTDLIL